MKELRSLVLVDATERTIMLVHATAEIGHVPGMDFTKEYARSPVLAHSELAFVISVPPGRDLANGQPHKFYHLYSITLLVSSFRKK